MPAAQCIGERGRVAKAEDGSRSAPGFIAAQHIEAVRRLGDVEVVAIAGSSLESARAARGRNGASTAHTATIASCIADPDVDVVHNTTPNHLHLEVSLAALPARKHVISDKPLSDSAEHSRVLWEAARRAGVAHVVTFNYRGNPLVQEARSMVSRGELGPLCYVHGQYLQDWLADERVYSWRLDPARGGASSALRDIGSHWCDLAEHVTGLRIEAVLADLGTVVAQREVAARRRRRTFSRSDARRGTRGNRVYASRVRISRPCCCGFAAEPKAASRSARCFPVTRTICSSKSVAARRRCAGCRSGRTSSGSADSANRAS